MCQICQPASVGGASPVVLEIDCTGRGNGLVVDNICNASSSHGAAVIRGNSHAPGHRVDRPYRPARRAAGRPARRPARHIAPTRAEPGCLAFDVTEVPRRPGRFGVRARFTDRAAFGAPRQRASDRARVAAGSPRHYSLAEVDPDARPGPPAEPRAAVTAAISARPAWVLPSGVSGMSSRGRAASGTDPSPARRQGTAPARRSSRRAARKRGAGRRRRAETA